MTRPDGVPQVSLDGLGSTVDGHQDSVVSGLSVCFEGR